MPASVIFALSLLVVFLILAAQYESWSLPFSVLLGTPDRGLRRLRWRSGCARFENNVFAQIGLVMLIGLAAKNAILIVEFAKVEHERGSSLVEAALAGARLRLRPILMTAFAFILGVRAARDRAAARAPRPRKHARHGGDRRHARRHVDRDLPDPGLVLRERVVPAEPGRGARTPCPAPSRARPRGKRAAGRGRTMS